MDRNRYLQLLASREGNGRIKIITGIRRCGKSYLLNTLFRNTLKKRGVAENHIIYLALDDNANNQYRNPIALGQFLRSQIKDGNRYYFLLDEIQRVFTIINPIFTGGEIRVCKDPNDEQAYGFQDVINGLRMIENADVYITGSNSKFLSRDIMTEFRDRGDEIYVQPLSFQEIYETLKPVNVDDAFNEYMKYGGMPLVFSYSSPEDKMNYLNNLFELTYHKDIEEHNGINKKEELITLIRVLASDVGSLVNPIAIENTFHSVTHSHLSKGTIAKYLQYLEDAFLIKEARRYDIKGRKEIGATYKYYFTDIGLRNSRVDFLHNDFGHLMENIIYNELIRRGYRVQIGVVDAFVNDQNGKTTRKSFETDFVATLGDHVYYIQSAYEMNSKEKVNQERNSLLRIDNSFRKIIITRNGGPVYRDEYGITYMGIIPFLLDEKSLDY